MLYFAGLFVDMLVDSFIRSLSEILLVKLLLPSSGHTRVLFRHYVLILVAPF